MIGYRASHSIYIRAGYTRTGYKGMGPWQKDSDAQEIAEGITGVATGPTNMRFSSPIVTVRKTFRASHVTQPFIEGGGGWGTVKVNFNGTFNGVDSYGDSFSIPNVTDKVVQHVPIIITSVGVARRVRGGWLIPAYQCNTGSNGFVVGFRMDLGGFGRK
jgi:hypothetical protein